MDMYEAIAKRRTIRHFTEPATEEVLKRIIMAGTMAASPINLQSWEFIIVDNPELIEQIAQHKYLQNERTFSGSGAGQKNAYKNCNIVAVCCEKKVPQNLWAAWMCMQNMYLAATAEGLGIVPSELWGEDRAAVEKLLDLPENYRLAAVVLVGKQKGYPNLPKIKRRPEWSWLHRNHFGTKP
jgi:5,6-dimethylbenzimidazole synthase